MDAQRQSIEDADQENCQKHDRRTAGWRILLSLNPVAYIVECFRYGWLGSGIVSIPNLMIGLGIILLILFVGTVMFNKTQRNFMDTV